MSWKTAINCYVDAAWILRRVCIASWKGARLKIGVLHW